MTSRGIYAGTDVTHLYFGDIAICRLCYGFYDDPRHWLPAPLQHQFDTFITDIEDRQRPPVGGWRRIRGGRRVYIRYQQHRQRR